MNNNIGTLITSIIKTFSDLDVFPVADANDLLGGFKVVSTINDRNNIPLERRVEGNFCYIINEEKLYKLKGGLLNINWVLVDSYGNSNQLKLGDGNLIGIGENNGIASLDSGGKIPVSQLPNSIMEYKGNYDALNNIPTLIDGIGNPGDTYRVNIAGPGVNLLGYVVGDYVVYSGTIWEKSHGGSDSILSVNGKSGIVILDKSDIGLSNVPNLDTTNAVNNQHNHDNKNILDSITEAFTTTLKNNYDNKFNSPNGNPSQYIAGDGSIKNFTTDNTTIGILNASNGIATIASGNITLSATPPVSWIDGQSVEVQTTGNISFSGINFTSGTTFNIGDKLRKRDTQWEIIRFAIGDNTITPEKTDFKSKDISSGLLKDKYSVYFLTEQFFSISGYISSTGTLTASSSGVVRTDYIKVPTGATQIRYAYGYSTGTGLINFYSSPSTSSRISTITTYNSVSTGSVFTIPQNCTYIICAGQGKKHLNYSQELRIEFLDSSNNILPVESFVDLFEYLTATRKLLANNSKFVSVITSLSASKPVIDSNDFYFLCTQKGTYTNFGVTASTNGLHIIRIVNNVTTLTTLISTTNILQNTSALIQSATMKSILSGAFRVDTTNAYESLFIYKEFINSSGQNISSSSGVLRTDYITIPVGANIVEYTYGYTTGNTLIEYFDSSYNEISRVTSYTEKAKAAKFSIPDGTAYIILAGRGINHASYDANYPLKVSFYTATTTNVSALTENAFTSAGYISSTGTLTPSVSGVVRLDNFAVPVDALKIRYSYSYNTGVGLLSFYNGSTRISTITSYSEVGTDVLFDIPATTTNIYASARGSSHSSFSNAISLEFLDSSNNPILVSNTSYTLLNFSIDIFNIKQFITENIVIDNSVKYIIESPIDPNDPIWNATLAYGLNTGSTPVPLQVNGGIVANGTIVSYGGKRRWNTSGLAHIFEGYSKYFSQRNYNGVMSNYYERFTTLIDKHEEFGCRLAELYYYYNLGTHKTESYGGLRLGSDVANHSFLFFRDVMRALGEVKLHSLLTLLAISPTNDLITNYNTVQALDSAFEAETESINHSKGLLYLALKNAENGAIFHDKDRGKIVVKMNGIWNDLNFTPVQDGTYNF